MSNSLNAALAAIQSNAGEDLDSQVIAAKCIGLMRGYDARWGDVPWRCLSVEEVFHLPVINPETGAASRTFTQAGKYDGIVEYGGRNYLLEHKTTSEEIADPHAPYWRRLAIDSQVSAYALANWQSGRKLDGTLYDVICKPGIRPKQLKKADLAHLVSSRKYCGFEVPENILNKIVLHGQERECPTLYSLRLASDCIENGQEYFQRKIVPRLDSEIGEYASEMWEVGQSILHARSRNAHYRNSDSCMSYGTPCQFLGICSGHDNPDSDKWTRAANVHAELTRIPGDGKSVLTNSRIKCFQTCRRKHQYRYEIGLRRVDEEEKEALHLGRLIHLGLEAWWSSFMKGNDNGCNTNAPASNEFAGATSQAELEF